jgi:hypothetical protein
MSTDPKSPMWFENAFKMNPFTDSIFYTLS